MAREPQAVGRGAPEVGTIVGGYRFDGGNHRDRSNWTQVERVDVSSDYGPGAMRFPNGTLVRVGPKGGVTEITPLGEEAEANGAVDVKEFQANAAARATLMDQGETDYQRARLQGYDPTSQRNSIARWTEGVPILGVPVSNLIRDSVADRGRAAELQFTDGALRTTTGANAPEPEVIRADRTYFRQPGEDEGVDPTRSQIRQRFRDQAVRIAGDAYINPVAANAEAGEIDAATGLPTYPNITQTVAGVQDSIVPGTRGEGRDGRSDEDLIAAGYERGEDGSWRKNFTIEELEAQGLKWDGQRWTGGVPAVAAPQPEGRQDRVDWTPEGAVAQRREMWSPLRNIDAAVRGAADIFSVEGADEFAAGADALFGQGNGDNYGERYSSNLRVQRAIDEADGEDVGLARRVGQGAAVVALASRTPQLLARNALAPAATQGARYLQLARAGIGNALSGAGVGAVAGFNGAEDGESRFDGARNGGMIGAAAGVAAPVIGNALVKPLARRGASVARFLGRQLGRAGEALEVPNSAALTRVSTPNALDPAIDRLGDRLGAVRSNALVDRANTMANEDLTPAFVDALDDGGQGIVRALGTRQTPARESLQRFARGRRVAAQEDASNLARRYVSNEPRTARQVADDLDIENRRLSGDEYAAARAAPPITIDGDTSAALWGPEGLNAMQQASRLYASSADPAERALSSEFASMAELASAPQGGASMSVGAADLLARYLQRAGGSDQNAQRIFGGLGRAVRNAARSQSDEYDTAVSNFAERAQLEEGAELGQQFLGRGGTADFSRQANALTPPQRQLARVSARDAIEDRASTPGGAATLLDDLEVGLGRDIRSQGLLGAEEAAAMRRTAGQMRQRLVTGRNVDPRSGSQTNLNAQDSAVVDGLDAAGDMVQAATQFSVPAAARLARRFRSRGFSDREAEALVEAAIDPARTAELITRLSTRMSRREARRLQRGITHSLAQSGAAQ